MISPLLSIPYGMPVISFINVLLALYYIISVPYYINVERREQCSNVEDYYSF